MGIVVASTTEAIRLQLSNSATVHEEEEKEACG